VYALLEEIVEEDPDSPLQVRVLGILRAFHKFTVYIRTLPYSTVAYPVLIAQQPLTDLYVRLYAFD
jgi:hypothetical protein